MCIIKFENITYFYPNCNKAVIENLSFSIEKSEIISIIGETGSGKTTLSQLISGQLKPQSGKIFLFNKDIWKCKKKQHVPKIALVSQFSEHHLFEETIFKDLSSEFVNQNLTQREVLHKINNAINLVGLHKTVLKKSSFELSGGEKRLAAFASVILRDPEVLIFDEPTAGLDFFGETKILKFIENYSKIHKKTIIFITHSMENAAKLSDKVMITGEGKIIDFDKPSKIFSNEKFLKTLGLDLPEITKMFNYFNEKGCNFKKNVLTIEKGESEILRKINKN